MTRAERRTTKWKMQSRLARLAVLRNHLRDLADFDPALNKAIEVVDQVGAQWELAYEEHIATTFIDGEEEVG